MPALVWLLLAACALAGALAAGGGGWSLLVAGREEARGRAERARRLARLGGFAMILGTRVQLTATLALGAAPPLRSALLPPRGDAAAALALVLFTVLGLAAAFSGLLAGLSGKPRTAGRVAAFLLGVALACWLFALGRLWPGTGA